MLELEEDTLKDRREKLCLRFAENCTKDAKFSKWFKTGIKTRTRILYSEPEAKTRRYRNSAIPYLTRLLNSRSWLKNPLWRVIQKYVSCWIMRFKLNSICALLLYFYFVKFLKFVFLPLVLFNKPYYYHYYRAYGLFWAWQYSLCCIFRSPWVDKIAPRLWVGGAGMHLCKTFLENSYWNIRWRHTGNTCREIR